ncbi:hypothetical protein HZA33_05160 [Candidatus Pacearchaeota archaeon]|nr:hypothetical protein [Candidatus Pacearchaeota archaeon]
MENKGYKDFFKKMAKEELPKCDPIHGFHKGKLLLSEFNKETGESLRYYLHGDGSVHKHDLTNSIYTGKDLGEISNQEYDKIFKLYNKQREEEKSRNSLPPPTPLIFKD